LNIPVIQEKISRIASGKLRETLGVPVEIEGVDFELFNKLIIRGIYLEDRQGEALFQARRLAVGFDFLPLFKGKLRFSSAQLFSFQFNLSKENDDSPLNIQFVIDAFASKDTIKKENNIDLAIKNLSLRRGDFTYNVKSAPQTKGIFNAKHIEINNIATRISIDRLTSSELVADINGLSFNEKSGLIVRRMALDLNYSKDSATIKKMNVLLPQSSLLLENITANFNHDENSNTLIKDTEISLQISPSTICLKDLKSLVPAFANYRDLLAFEGKLSGKMNQLKLDNFLLTDGDKLLVRANMEVENLFNSNNTFIRGAVKQSFIAASEITKIANNFSDKPIELPEHISRLGDIRFEGEISGYFQHLTAYGLFKTGVGNIRTDIQIGKNNTNFIKGEIKSQDLNLNKLLSNDNYGMANFEISVDAQQNRNNKYEGSVDARIKEIEFKQYTYENINLKGNFTETSFNGILNIDSPEGKLLSEGFVQLNGNKSIFNFSAQAQHIKLDKLNLSKKYKDSDLSLNLNVNFTGNNIDNLLGYINIKDVRFSTERGEYNLDSLTLSSQISDSNNKILSITSDLVSGNITGQYSFNDIVPALMETGNAFLPAVIKTSQKKIVSENNFNIDITIKDTEEFSHILDLPFVLYDETKIQGNYDHESNKFKLEVSSPKSGFNKMLFENCFIDLEKQNNETALLKVNATNTKKDKRNTIAATFTIAGNKIDSKLIWNSKQDPYNGLFDLSTQFTEQTGAFPLKTEINFSDSKVTFKDSIWSINPSQIVLDSAKIKINQLSIDHADQFVKVNGIISKQPSDSLFVNLNKVDLDYIFDILSIRTFELGGKVSGYAVANDVYHTRQLSTRLNVENFSFNKSVIGNLKLSGIWDDTQQGIQLLGDAQKNDSSNLKVNGMLYPIKQTLNLNFDAQNVNATFLRRYLDQVAKNLSGLLTGKVNLFGNFSDVTLAGDAFVKNGSFGVDFLNTTYTFSDYVHLKPDEISIKNATFYDQFGRKALVNGTVKHKYLSDFKFSADIIVDNFLVFNATERKNPFFFGSAFGTGSVNIRGDENLINFDVKLRSDEKTKITLNLMEQNDIEEYDFINFISKKEKEPQPLDKILTQLTNKPVYLVKKESGTDIKFNLQLTATPDATIEMIMDPVSGDKIKGYGEGNLNIQYGTTSPLKLFGKYTLEKGIYNFSFQQAFYREFQIREGSSISFNGDPFGAILDMEAVYSLTANISDLSESLAQEASRLNIPVNCILKIKGEMERPDIKFDIELPNSTEDLERQIKALINTEDMMNRQIVYLMVLNKFYTQDVGAASPTQKSNDFASLAASSISSQLSSILGSFNENIRIGTVFSTNTGDFSDTEMALILSSQLLNNRLIINGNFGYRDNPFTNSSFIGDFDLEYKLTKAGDIRLRAYNHYNDRFSFLRTAYTTQGIGLLYRKDFNNFRYILRKRPPSVLKLTLKNDSTVSFLPKTPETGDFIRFKTMQSTQ